MNRHTPWRALLRCTRGDAADGIIIEIGTPQDYHALSYAHYRAGPPATIERVLRAVDVPTGIVAGVLVLSHPTLNGPWRARAWKDPPIADKRSLAGALNTNLRAISRVVVDTRFRGLGVARRLVASYLAAPLTARTEALAAMGSVCPFFERAGMRRVPVTPSRRAAALNAALARSGIEAWRLMDTDAAAALLARDEKIRIAVRRYAGDSRATRASRDVPGALLQLTVRGAADACSPPAAYVWP